MTPADFKMKMHSRVQSQTSLKYPPGGLLQLRGVVKEDELRKPTMLEKNGERCLFVIKNGSATGATIASGKTVRDNFNHLLINY